MTKSISEFWRCGGRGCASGREQEGGITEGQERTLESDGEVPHLDHGGGFMGVCVCQNVKLSDMCS